MDYSPCVCMNMRTTHNSSFSVAIIVRNVMLRCTNGTFLSVNVPICFIFLLFHMHTHTQGAPGHGPPVPASPSDSQRVGKHATGPRSPHHHQVSGECHMNHIKRLAYFKKLMLVVEMCFWNPFICCVCHSEFLTCVNQDNDSLACIALFSASFMYTSSIFLFVF